MYSFRNIVKIVGLLRNSRTLCKSMTFSIGSTISWTLFSSVYLDSAFQLRVGYVGLIMNASEFTQNFTQN